MGRSHTFLESEVKQAAKSVGDAMDDLQQFQQQSDLEVVRKQMEIHLERLDKIELERQNVLLGLAKVNGELERFEKELASQPRTLTMKRHLAKDTAYQGVLSKLS